MYGNDDNGSGTASGRPFDENEFRRHTKTLPFGTRLAVTKGSKRVIVTVTDRGPYTPGRMLDLSRRSARYLGVDGSAPCRSRSCCRFADPTAGRPSSRTPSTTHPRFLPDTVTSGPHFGYLN